MAERGKGNGKPAGRVTRAEIDGMIETCIGMVLHGKTMRIKQYQEYRELLGRAAKEGGTSLPGWKSRWQYIYGRATNLLIDASEIGLVTNPRHKEIIKKSEILGRIEMVLADLGPKLGYQHRGKINSLLLKSNPDKPLGGRWCALESLTKLDLGKLVELKQGTGPDNQEYYKELERLIPEILTRLPAELARLPYRGRLRGATGGMGGGGRKNGGGKPSLPLRKLPK